MRVAITGASGSLGRRLVWYFATELKVERVVALIRSEYALALHYDWFRQYLAPQDFDRIKWMQGDIRDQPRMEKAFYGCHRVIHTAALKRVDSIMENPTEVIQTNIDGLVTTLEAAMQAQVSQFIFVSSDKAVSPENSYGATKMLGEDIVRSFNVYASPRGMSCLSVRYGNVLGSRGSVYWVWRKALAEEHPIIYITSKAMTRFFMSFETAITTIRTAVARGQAGQTIIPHCPAYLLTDFLEAMLEVFVQDGRKVAIVETGLRHGGEKYDESLCNPNQLGSGFFILHANNASYTVFPGVTSAQDLGASEGLLSSNVEARPLNRLSVQQLGHHIAQFETKDRLHQFDHLPEGQALVGVAS